MDIKLKQRILGITVLIGLLAFCLFTLVKSGKKNQLHLPAINIEPPVSQAVSNNQNQTTKTHASTSEIQPANLNASTPSATTSELKNTTSANTSTVTPSNDPNRTDALNAIKQIENTKIAPEEPNTSTSNTPSTQTSTPTSNQPITKSTTQTTTQAPTKNSSEPAQNTQLDSTQVQKMSHLLLSKPMQEEKNHTHHKTSSNKKEKINKKPHALSESGNYIVQVGAFKETSNIHKLTTALTQKGYVVNTKKIKTSSQHELTVITVGGRGLDYQHAEKLRVLLEHEFHITPIIKNKKSDD